MRLTGYLSGLALAGAAALGWAGLQPSGEPPPEGEASGGAQVPPRAPVSLFALPQASEVGRGAASGTGQTESARPLDGDRWLAEMAARFDGQPASTWDALVTRLNAEFADRLPAEQRPAAQALLQRYARYRQAAASAHAEHDLDAQSQRAWLARLRALRSQHFGPAEGRALFEAEDQMLEDRIARDEILNAPHWTDAQKWQLLAAQDASVAPTVRAAREARGEPLTVLEQVPSEEGGGPSYVRRALRPL